jgi:predicted MFS family arabinose efflux permease
MRILVFNLAVALVGLAASFTLKDWAQVFAGVATGIYFSVQTVIAVRNRHKRRRDP